MRDKRIGVLMGGLSAEREISLTSGEAACAALRERGYAAERVFVDRDLDLVLRQLGVEVAFLALAGRWGEDGCVQGLLEMLHIPYTGSGVRASALAANKAKAKELFRLHSLTTPAYYTVLEEAGDQLPMEQLHGSFGFPCVVKPASEGSSIGVALARDLFELEAAIGDAHRLDDEALVERWIPGRQITVAILGDRPLGAIEIAPPGGGPFDYAAKLTGRVEQHYPARLTPERYRAALLQALAAHRALGCEGATLVDLVVAESGDAYVLEVDTLPSLAPEALLPTIARGEGLSLGDLAEGILEGAQLKAQGFRGRDRRSAQVPFRGPERRANGTVEPN